MKGRHTMYSKEISKALTLTSLVLLLAVSGFCAESILLTATDSTPVVILRDEYGVPHILAETEAGVFYGQGFAVAQDRLYQMEVNRRAAEGKLSEWFGSSFIAADQAVRRIYHTPQERIQMFDSLPTDLQNMFSSYSDGVNAYIDSMNANPAVYKPFEFETNGFTMEPWTVFKSLAFTHLFLKRFGGRGGSELVRLAELQALGQEAFDELRPINDPTSPTTILGGCDPKSFESRYSGMVVNPAIVEKISAFDRLVDSLLSVLHVPKKLGSFAALISASKSATGQVMVLGCPQSNTSAMNSNTPNIWHEIELYCPTLHFGGMAVAGIPLGMIGHNDQMAFTATSGLSDNIDVYIDSSMDASYSSYWYNGSWVPFDTIVDTIYNDLGTPTIFTHYRTVHGPVFGDDLVNHQVYSYKMSFWNDESSFIRTFNDFARAANLAELEAALAQNPYSFNFFYAGRDQNIKYWHTGKFQDRSDGVDPRLPHKGDGSEEWGGFIPFDSLPQEMNPDQGYFVNWNNKPVCWWNNGDYVINETTRLRVNEMYAYIEPIIDGFSFDDLKEFPLAVSAHGNYQQAIVVPDSGEYVDENIVPPGQSGFIDINGLKDTHFDDQWSLHLSWDFKDMLFGYPCIDSVDTDSDLIDNSCDNCQIIANSLQEDIDTDGIGDSCDNCIDTPNPSQADADSDGIGDACCCVGIRGDLNGDGDDANILDLTFAVDRIFRGGGPPGCPIESDANGDGDPLSILDLTFLVDFIFRGGGPPGSC